MVVNTTAEPLPGDPEILGFFRENQRDFESIFVQFLTWAKERCELDSSANVEASALYLYTFQGGLQVVAKVDCNRTRLVAVVDAALKVFLVEILRSQTIVAWRWVIMECFTLA